MPTGGWHIMLRIEMCPAHCLLCRFSSGGASLDIEYCLYKTLLVLHLLPAGVYVRQ